MSEYFKIGTLKVKECTRRNGFECAAWYENVKITPGEYDLMAARRREYNTKEHRFELFDIDKAYAVLPGTIISDEFGGLFCGNPISVYDNYKNAGKPARHIEDFRGYELAYTILNQDGIELQSGKRNLHGCDDYEIVLDDGYKAEEYSFTSFLDENETLYMARIVG